MQGHDGMKTKTLIPNAVIDRVKAKIAHTTAPETHANSTNTVIQALNSIIGGWCRYYQYTGKASTVFGKIDRYAFWKLVH